MASTYLSKTLSTPTNGQKWTWSGWIKRSKLDGDQALFNAGGSGSPNVTIRFGYSGGDNKIYVFYLSGGSMVWEFATNAQFRDTSGWYHIVISYDSTQLTATNRLKLYVNNSQQTFSNSTNSSQDITTTMNSAVVHYIGNNNGGNYFDGSMAHVHFIDGTAYDASAFGETDATTGIWKIKTSPSVTYGTNGFFILKDGNSVTDQSGNGNNFTVGGGTLTNTEDNPSNVFCTINPLNPPVSGLTLANGNLSIIGNSSKAWRSSPATLGVSSGKWYWETKVTSFSAGLHIGIMDYEQVPQTNTYAYQFSRAYMYKDDGNKANNGVNSAYGNSFTTGDIIGCAFDLDNYKIYWSKNGVWQNSGDPTSGATGTGSAFDLSSGYTYTPINSTNETTDQLQANFGNGYFGTTAVASAGTNASGNGIFEYDVPTGYTALSTKGLNL